MGRVDEETVCVEIWSLNPKDADKRIDATMRVAFARLLVALACARGASAGTIAEHPDYIACRSDPPTCTSLYAPRAPRACSRTMPWRAFTNLTGLYVSRLNQCEGRAAGLGRAYCAAGFV